MHSRKPSAGSSLTATSPPRPNRTKSLLRKLLSVLRLLILLLSLYLLGLFIYLVVTLKRNSVSLNASKYTRETLSILIISGASSLWALSSLILTCTGHSLASMLMIAIDALLMGAFIGVSILLANQGLGLKNCNKHTPQGAPNRNCKLIQTSFVFAIALAAFYAIAAILSAILFLHFRKARPFGPGPENGYHPEYNAVPKGKKGRDSEARGYFPPALPAAGARTSGMTDYTAYSGSTMAHPQTHTEAPVSSGFTDPAAVRTAPVGGPHVGGVYEAYRAPATKPDVAAAPAPYSGRPVAF